MSSTNLPRSALDRAVSGQRANRPVMLVKVSLLAALALAAGLAGAPARVSAQTPSACAANPVTARGEPSRYEWLAKTKARANWRRRVRLVPELGATYADWKLAADIEEKCLIGDAGTVCILTGTPCRK